MFWTVDSELESYVFTWEAVTYPTVLWSVRVAGPQPNPKGKRIAVCSLLTERVRHPSKTHMHSWQSPNLGPTLRIWLCTKHLPAGSQKVGLNIYLISWRCPKACVWISHSEACKRPLCLHRISALCYIRKQINFSVYDSQIEYIKKMEKKKINLLLHVSLFQSENSRHKGLIEHTETGGIVSQRLVSPTQGLHLPSQIPPQHSVQVKWNAVAEERGQYFDHCQEEGVAFQNVYHVLSKRWGQSAGYCLLLLWLHRCS